MNLKKKIKDNWKVVLIESTAGFIGWCACVSPYMLLVVRMDLDQYIKWVIACAVLNPIIAPIVIRFTNWMKSKVLKYKLLKDML